MKIDFKITDFAMDIRNHRGSKSLRDIEQETGLSAATLSRAERGNIPDLLTYATLCQWMGVSMNKYFSEQNDVLKEVLREIVGKMKKHRADYLWAEPILEKIDKL